MYCMYCMYCMYLNPTHRVANKLVSLSLSCSVAHTWTHITVSVRQTGNAIGVEVKVYVRVLRPRGGSTRGAGSGVNVSSRWLERAEAGACADVLFRRALWHGRRRIARRSTRSRLPYVGVFAAGRTPRRPVGGVPSYRADRRVTVRLSIGSRLR